MKLLRLLTAAPLLVCSSLVSGQTDAAAGAEQLCHKAYADKRLDRLRSRMPLLPLGGDGTQITKRMINDSGKATPADKAALDILLEAQLACAKATFEEMGGDTGRRSANDPGRRADYSARLAPLRNGSMSFGEFNVAQEFERAGNEVRARKAAEAPHIQRPANSVAQPLGEHGTPSVATFNCTFRDDGLNFDLPVLINYSASTVNGMPASFGDTAIRWLDSQRSDFVLNRLSGTVAMKIGQNDYYFGRCLTATQKF